MLLSLCAHSDTRKGTHVRTDTSRLPALTSSRAPAHCLDCRPSRPLPTTAPAPLACPLAVLPATNGRRWWRLDAESCLAPSFPTGHYCPAGTSSPLPCPEGNLNPREGALSSRACQPCPAGMYCPGEGNGQPEGRYQQPSRAACGRTQHRSGAGPRLSAAACTSSLEPSPERPQPSGREWGFRRCRWGSHASRALSAGVTLDKPASRASGSSPVEGG